MRREAYLLKGGRDLKNIWEIFWGSKERGAWGMLHYVLYGVEPANTMAGPPPPPAPAYLTPSRKIKTTQQLNYEIKLYGYIGYIGMHYAGLCVNS
jgi:hypothetical protein